MKMFFIYKSPKLQQIKRASRFEESNLVNYCNRKLTKILEIFFTDRPAERGSKSHTNCRSIESVL